MAAVRFTVTNRSGGISAVPYESLNLGAHVGDDLAAVESNRQRLARRLHRPVLYLDQVHGTGIAVLEPGADLLVPDGTDAAVTTRSDVALAVLVADCVPVLAGDAGSGVIGVAHAGRKGSAAGIVPLLVEQLVLLGARADRLDVVLGPAICGRCYEVPAALRDEVDAALPGAATTTGSGTPGLDLRAGLARQLAQLGVETVRRDPRCTAEDATLFSYRRDGRTGRQAGLVWLD